MTLARAARPHPRARFVYDVTNKPSGKRFTMDEVGLFTVVNGKITREEFFYQVA